MNAIFFMQGRSLQMFVGVMDALRAHHGLDRAGLYVAEAANYREFTRNRDLSACTQVLEWDVVRAARHHTPDMERLRRYDTPGEPLSRAIVADRRLYYGPLCTLRQDYRRRFTDAQLLAIIDRGIEAMERLFDEVRPDVVISFICVTFGEYLGQLVARRRNVPILNLRATKIDNYVTLAPSIIEPSGLVRAEMGRPPGADPEAAAVAADFLARARRASIKYEGVIPVSHRPPVGPRALRPGSGLGRLVAAEWAHRTGGAEDNHAVSPLATLYYQRIANPLRARRMNSALEASYVRKTDVPGMRFAFFPLHTEPEVTLLVQSPEYLNQIEVVRLLSQSLPVGCSLVVKEHPAAIGKRSLGYYRKLLRIPGVRIADPALESQDLIAGSILVATIAGSIGFEAALQGRPVVTFGHTPYELLPPTMVRRITPAGAAGAIADLLANYRFDEDAVLRYLTAMIRCSAPVNLYSTLLGREGVHVPGRQAGWDVDTRALADLAARLLPAVRQLGPSPAATVEGASCP